MSGIPVVKRKGQHILLYSSTGELISKMSATGASILADRITILVIEANDPFNGEED